MSGRVENDKVNARAAESAQPDSFEIRFLRQMAAADYDVARFKLAKRYMEGKGVGFPSDFLAFRYLREMNRQDHPVAHRMMGKILTRDQGVPPNPALAHRHYRASWRLYQDLLKWNPMPITLTRLGSIYENGLGVDRDLEIASRYYMESAQRGEIEGAWKVVEFCNKEIFASTGPEQATGWRERLQSFLVAAEDGDMIFQYKLGQLFSMNRIVPPDHVQSAYWFGKATDGRLIDAYLPMGEHYEFGLGVEQDEAKALELYREAVRTVGDEEARYRAAALILNRDALNPDMEEISEFLFGGVWERYPLGRLLSEWVREKIVVPVSPLGRPEMR